MDPPVVAGMFVSGAVVYRWIEVTHPDFGTHEPPKPAPAGSAQPATDD